MLFPSNLDFYLFIIFEKNILNSSVPEILNHFPTQSLAQTCQPHSLLFFLEEACSVVSFKRNPQTKQVLKPSPDWHQGLWDFHHLSLKCLSVFGIIFFSHIFTMNHWIYRNLKKKIKKMQKVQSHVHLREIRVWPP